LFALLMFQLIRKLLRVGSTENDEHMRNQVTARLQRALPGRLMQRFEHTRARWRRTCSADVQLDCNIPTRRHCGHCAACRWDPAENRCATDPRAARRGTARHGKCRKRSPHAEWLQRQTNKRQRLPESALARRP
jgi:hypothetical protein